jgi:HEAT repeat protein
LRTSRFLEDGPEIDRTCAAKRAIARALYDLDYDSAAFWHRYLNLRQLDPGYGGPVDSAVDVRCTCALGLVASGDPRAVLSLLELLHDSEWQARLGAVKALELVQPFHAEIVLRHKILEGDEEPEVIAQCFSSLAKAAPEESVEFIASFLRGGDHSAREGAALALGESRLDEALELLIGASDELLFPSEAMLETFYRAIALQRNDRAYAYLLDKIATGSEREAVQAAAALSIYSYNQDLKDLVTAIAKSRRMRRLSAVLNSHWED